ncbi:DUF1772 domain-containing protein [Nocardia cyriacigeorgica]|uniref:anthrone oxygenase family protein n=1 Tax=Nocardia cyriacigeorgica TaxID=135487 RepID=UPI0024574596|nr:anthrone oxygenase family protein [Nocardia cyriacigeorgica]
MHTVQTLTLLVATVTTGLMAGLFTAFAYSVMPGLHRSSDRTFVEAMQHINSAILNPAFMIPFAGSVPLLILAATLAWRGTGRSVLIWIVAATVLYLIAFVVTGGVNVPLNDKLAAAGSADALPDPTTVRTDFESSWVAWNMVRAALHTAAFACLVWALIGYGGERNGFTIDRHALGGHGADQLTVSQPQWAVR